MKKIYTLIIVVLFSVTASSQIIVIDPGHGYGATVSDNPDGRTAIEIETALEVGLRTKALIQTSCVWTVQMTRTTNVNGWISVNQRALMANNWNADRLLSIHCNAGGGTGTETFYCTDGDTNTAPDIAFASKIQTDMVSTGQWSNRRCVEDMSFLAYHLGVLKYSSATACLNEIGFVDSADATKLTSSTWRDQFALAYFNAFKSNLNLTCNALPAPGTFSLTVTPECNGSTSRNNLTWTSSTNATSYDIYRNGVVYASNITASPYLNTAITAGTTYTYSVKAKNTTGQTSNSNGDVSATALNCSAPGTFTLTVIPECINSVARINLTWTASANATGYDIYRNGALYASDITGTQFLNTYMITPGTVYTYSVKAKNTMGQLTNSNGTVSVTAVGCAPGTFTLSATATCSGSASAINLSWSTSANATSYDIYRNGNLYASDITGTTFLNTYLITAGTSYTYFVKAKNSIGTLNNSNGSISITATSCTAKTAMENNVTEITLYPNPTSGIFNLNISNSPDKPMTYHLFDRTGKVVYESKVESSTTSIDISHLPSGIYFISILIDNKEVVKRIVKR